MLKLILISYSLIQMAPAPCPDHNPGCAVAHYQAEIVQHKKVVSKKEEAQRWCADKNVRYCSSREITFEELSRILDQNSIWRGQ